MAKMTKQQQEKLDNAFARAVIHHQVAEARALIEKGASPNMRGPNMVPLFHVPIYENDIEMVKLMLEYDVLDIPDAQGYTALNVAVGSSRHRILEVLLEAGLLVNDCPDLEVMWDEVPKNEKARRLMGTKPIHVAVSSEVTPESIEVFDILVREGADINALNNYGETPLHVASRAYWTKRLVDQDANLQARTTMGWTPAHCAAAFVNPEVLKALSDAGASLDAKNYAGDTVIEYMRQCPGPDFQALIAEYDQAKLTESLPQATKQKGKGGMRL